MKGPVDFCADMTIFGNTCLQIKEDLTLVLPLATTIANSHFSERQPIKTCANISTETLNRKKKSKSKCDQWWHERPGNNYRESPCSCHQMKHCHTANSAIQSPTGREPLPGGDLCSFHWLQNSKDRWRHGCSTHIAWLAHEAPFPVSELCWRERWAPAPVARVMGLLSDYGKPAYRAWLSMAH